jgi:plastocyanin
MRGLLAGCSALLIVGLLLPAVPGGQTPDATTSGTVTGRVKLSRVRGTALPSNAYSPRAVAGPAPAASPEIRNVVVYLTGVSYAGTLPASQHKIVQEGETFVPRVLAVTRGSTVSFPNADPIFHNVFSLSSAASFNLGRYPKGESRAREFTKPGLVKVYCQIHSHMSATILVLGHPYFTVPVGADGAFTLQNVPPGRHTIVGWHERVGDRTATIQVDAGKISSVEISLPIEDGP